MSVRSVDDSPRFIFHRWTLLQRGCVYCCCRSQRICPLGARMRSRSRCSHHGRRRRRPAGALGTARGGGKPPSRQTSAIVDSRMRERRTVRSFPRGDHSGTFIRNPSRMTVCAVQRIGRPNAQRRLPSVVYFAALQRHELPLPDAGQCVRVQRMQRHRLFIPPIALDTWPTGMSSTGITFYI